MHINSFEERRFSVNWADFAKSIINKESI